MTARSTAGLMPPPRKCENPIPAYNAPVAIPQFTKGIEDGACVGVLINNTINTKKKVPRTVVRTTGAVLSEVDTHNPVSPSIGQIVGIHSSGI